MQAIILAGGRHQKGYPLPMGRPANGLPGRREHSAVLSAAEKKRSSARALEEIIGASTGIHIPHNTFIA